MPPPETKRAPTPQRYGVKSVFNMPPSAPMTMPVRRLTVRTPRSSAWFACASQSAHKSAKKPLPLGLPQ